MNDNEIKYTQDDKNVYRATSNLNTAIENPQVNINSAVGVNIKNVNYNNDVYSSNIVNSNDYNNEVNASNFNYEDLPNNVQSIDGTNLEVNNFMSSQENFEQNFNNSSNINSNNFNSNLMDNEKKSQFISSESKNEINESNVSDYVSTSNEQSVYQPTMQDKKKKGISFNVTRELKVTLFIVFILLLFVLVIPYIYDFFRELLLGISTR